jgi:hypothetical protein
MHIGQTRKFENSRHHATFMNAAKNIAAHTANRLLQKEGNKTGMSTI